MMGKMNEGNESCFGDVCGEGSFCDPLAMLCFACLQWLAKCFTEVHIPRCTKTCQVHQQNAAAHDVSTPEPSKQVSDKIYIIWPWILLSLLVCAIFFIILGLLYKYRIPCKYFENIHNFLAQQWICTKLKQFIVSRERTCVKQPRDQSLLQTAENDTQSEVITQASAEEQGASGRDETSVMLDTHEGQEREEPTQQSGTRATYTEAAGDNSQYYMIRKPVPVVEDSQHIIKPSATNEDPVHMVEIWQNPN